jgi:hypothetical protein
MNPTAITAPIITTIQNGPNAMTTASTERCDDEERVERSDVGFAGEAVRDGHAGILVRCARKIPSAISSSPVA